MSLTKMVSMAVHASTVDDTPIGQGAAAAGAFTTLTANTTATSDNSNNAATTAFVHSLLGGFAPGSGSVTLPGGFIVKWGNYPGMPDTSAVTVSPLPGGAFPNNFYGAISIDTAHVGGNNRPCGALVTGLNSFTMSAQGSGASVFWLAIGD